MRAPEVTLTGNTAPDGLNTHHTCTPAPSLTTVAASRLGVGGVLSVHTGGEYRANTHKDLSVALVEGESCCSVHPGLSTCAAKSKHSSPAVMHAPAALPPLQLFVELIHPMQHLARPACLLLHATYGAFATRLDHPHPHSL